MKNRTNVSNMKSFHHQDITKPVWLESNNYVQKDQGTMLLNQSIYHIEGKSIFKQSDLGVCCIPTLEFG